MASCFQMLSFSDFFVQPSFGTNALKISESGNFYLYSKLHSTSADLQIL